MKWLLIGLTLIFTVFKLLNVITWSWWLVLLPGIVYVVACLVILILAIIGGFNE